MNGNENGKFMQSLCEGEENRKYVGNGYENEKNDKNGNNVIVVSDKSIKKIKNKTNLAPSSSNSALQN